jgi:hypothetical protein
LGTIYSCNPEHLPYAETGHQNHALIVVPEIINWDPEAQHTPNENGFIVHLFNKRMSSWLHNYHLYQDNMTPRRNYQPQGSPQTGGIEPLHAKSESNGNLLGSDLTTNSQS